MEGYSNRPPYPQVFSLVMLILTKDIPNAIDEALVRQRIA